MAFYDWNNALSVNVNDIDRQHMQLINLINRLFDAMSSGKGSDVLGKTLTDLITYTKGHFALEEKYMREYNYPLLSLHKTEHDKLTKQVLDLANEFQSGKTLISIKVMNFLKDWLNNHIMQNDKKFGEFLNSVGRN
jgi:hemerythrin-like metal-binding protein